jgi:hypothetical protein
LHERSTVKWRLVESGSWVGLRYASMYMVVIPSHLGSASAPAAITICCPNTPGAHMVWLPMLSAFDM